MSVFERDQTSTTPEQAPQRLPGPAHWLIVKNGDCGIEVLTFDRDGKKTLPVFSFEEEAEMFLRIGNVDDEWRVRESWVGEIVSVLYGPCKGVKKVALDPLPEMVAERFTGLVSLSRERFIERILHSRRHLELREPEREPPREGEWSPRGGAYWLAVSG